MLETERTHRNVLLFLLMLIHSCPDIFLPFASTFGPVLAVVASGRLAGAAATLDYFTSDLLCDIALACEIKHDKRTEEDGADIQAAQTHTSCSSQRRLRICNPSLSVCDNMGEPDRNYDLNTFVNFLAKQNVLTRTDALSGGGVAQHGSWSCGGRASSRTGWSSALWRACWPLGAPRPLPGSRCSPPCWSTASAARELAREVQLTQCLVR